MSRDDRRYVYGVKPVLEALRAHPGEVEGLLVADGDLHRGQAAEIFARARDAGVRVQKLPREKLLALSDGGVHQGIVAELRSFSYCELEDILDAAKATERPPLVVVLDGIQDPQNLGAIVRSAHAFGAHGVVIGKDRAAQVTAAASKASAGATERTMIARVTNVSRALEQLKEAGVWIAAADPEGDRLLWEARLDGPIGIVVGAEGAGIREGVLKHCDLRVHVPMSGQLASLNASVSAGVLLCEVARQRVAAE